MAPRNRLSPRLEALGPHGTSSRQHGIPSRSLLPPSGAQEKPLYTRTGRISKAKKGLKVHNCIKCGRSYTRAEHLRRHEKNHDDEPLRCKFPECGKKFHREDLLQRHEERHNDLSRPTSRAPSIASQHTVPDIDPSLAAPSTSLSATDLSLVADVLPHSLYSQNLAPPHQDMTRSSSRKPSASSSSHAYLRSVGPMSCEGYPFHEPWSPTQPYTSSSGYASPGYDYSGAAQANACYDPASLRTRTSSTASLAEPWQSYPHPISPISATSSLLFSWTDADKSPGLHALSLPVTDASSFGMMGPAMTAPHDPLGGLVMFPLPLKTHESRDEDEQKLLFPDEPFGLISNMYQSTQYMESYWRNFHPSFPIVHKNTFDLDASAQSPLLRAAMLAVGAQYSEQPNSQAESRSLLERCMKLLSQRDLDVNLPLRSCDMQAIFLLEVLSQYRGRRASPQLTTRFNDMYLRLSHDTDIIPTKTLDELSSIAPTADAHTQYTQWKHWIAISGKQRLLVACFILEAQQSTLLCRKLPTTIISGFELPVPAPTNVWDAESAPQWAACLQHQPSTMRYVYEISTQYVPNEAFMPLDAFQSALLIHTHYDPLSNSSSYFTAADHPALSQILETSNQTRLLYLAAQLSQAIPVLDLLAVSGESWILNEKVASKEAYETHKQALAGWVSKLWLPDATADLLKPVRPAVKLASEVLRLALEMGPDAKLTLGTEMCIYLAALVLWAVTSAAASRWHRSHTPAPPAPTISTPPAMDLPDPLRSKTLETSQNESVSFLHLASSAMDATNSRVLLDESMLKQWREGVCVLMDIFGDRLGGDPAGGGSALGELVDGVVGVLKKLGKRSSADLAFLF